MKPSMKTTTRIDEPGRVAAAELVERGDHQRLPDELARAASTGGRSRSESVPVRTRPLLLPTASTTTTRKASEPSACLPRSEATLMNVSPADAPKKYMAKSSQNCAVRSMWRQVNSGRARGAGRRRAGRRLHEVALRRVARRSSAQRADHDPGQDAQGDHRLRHALLDRALSGRGREHVEQPGGERRQHHRRQAEARHDDAGDEAGALRREPLDGGRRGGRVAEPHAAAGDHAEADDVRRSATSRRGRR